MASSSTSTILLVGGAAAVAYFGYTQGWFSNLIGSAAPMAAAPPPVVPTPAPGQTTPGTVGTTPPAPTAPPLDTTIVSLPQALAQIAAKDLYIKPNLDLYVLLQTAVPPNSGYNFYVDPNGLPLLLRNDVMTAVQASPAGATLTLDDIKKLITTAGLSGLGDFRRHMWTRTGRVARIA